MLRIIILAICLMALSMGICTCNTDANAIVAVRTASVDNLGHVGVGFQNDDGTWTIGGVEGDPDKTILWGAVVPPIFGDNGGWVEEHKTLQEVAVIFHALGYDGLKIIQVIDANPNLANFEIKSFPTRGYNVVNNNCLSATIDVLTAYGAKKLPLQIAHVAPNDYYANVKGEEYLWDSSKSTYTDLITGMPLAGKSSAFLEKTSSQAQELLKRNKLVQINETPHKSKTVTAESQQTANQLASVTLTLYVHDGSANGPIIPGAQVTGHDASGNSFQQTTDSSGYVTITGDPGTWSFSASADGYETNNWDQEITETCTKHAFLQMAEAQDDEKTSSTSAKSGSLSIKEKIAASRARLANQELVQSNPSDIVKKKSPTKNIIGKWLLTNKDGMWYMEFYKDGTFLGTNRWVELEQLQDSITAGQNRFSNGESGEWISDDDIDNVIRCQRENGKAYQWTLNGDAMNGFEIYLDGHRNPVSAERVHSGEFFPDED